MVIRLISDNDKTTIMILKHHNTSEIIVDSRTTKKTIQSPTHINTEAEERESPASGS